MRSNWATVAVDPFRHFTVTVPSPKSMVTGSARDRRGPLRPDCLDQVANFTPGQALLDGRMRDDRTIPRFREF